MTPLSLLCDITTLPKEHGFWLRPLRCAAERDGICAILRDAEENVDLHLINANVSIGIKFTMQVRHPSALSFLAVALAH
jgi:hypothetical protein